MDIITDDIMERLGKLDKELAAQCGKHDRATVLIQACLHEGINTGPAIIDTLATLKFDRRHVGIMLRENSGTNPKSNLWQKLDDGTYLEHS